MDKEMNNAEIRTSLKTEFLEAAVIKNAMDDFESIQRYMLLAKKESANETYNELKIKYLSLKALLSSLGVNLTGIDRIKENS